MQFIQLNFCQLFEEHRLPKILCLFSPIKKHLVDFRKAKFISNSLFYKCANMQSWTVSMKLPELVNLEHAEDGNGVHEGGVELEVGMVRADVVAA